MQAQPGDQTLTPGDSSNTVTATTELAFDVVVQDSGDSQEVGIPVTLTIEQGTGKPIVKTQKIELIDPGEKMTVTFDGPRRGAFAPQTTLKVDVAPVPGEANKDNNSAAVQGHLLALPYGAMNVSGNVAALIAIAAASSSGSRASRSRCVAWVRVRRVRDAQRMLIGGGRKDLVEFAVSLQGRIDDLHRAVDEIAGGLARVDRRVDTSVANTRDRPLRRLRGHRRPPVGVARAARRGAHAASS